MKAKHVFLELQRHVKSCDNRYEKVDLLLTQLAKKTIEIDTHTKRNTAIISGVGIAVIAGLVLQYIQ